MNQRILLLAFGTCALAVASAASAKVSVSVGINPYGYGAYSPPVVYQSDRYYSAPPVVYFGGGSWGNGHGRRSRGHDNRRDHYDRRDRNDHGH